MTKHPVPLEHAGRPANPTHLRPGSRAATHDPRWPAVAAALAELRERHRCAVRVVDADCGAGCLLLHTLRHARALGFTAIEGRGIDGAPALVGRARAAASRLADPAIGVEFELADMASALAAEHDMPADIVLWHGPSDGSPADIPEVVRRAGTMVMGDDREAPRHRLAA